MAFTIAGSSAVAPHVQAEAAVPPRGTTKSPRPTANKPAPKPRPTTRAAASKGPSSAAEIRLAKLPKARLQMGRALGKDVTTLDRRNVQGVELEPQRPRHGGDWYPVTYSGLEMRRADDADGIDEPAVWVAFVRRVGTRYEKTVKRVPASDAHSVSTQSRVSNAGAAELYRGGAPALMVAAVLEDDNGDSEAYLDALDDLLNQAIVAANLLDDEGDDPPTTLAGMLELGRPILGPKATRPDFRVVRISEAVWDGMYDREPKVASGGGPKASRRTVSVDYKLVTTHNVGKGKYRLFIDLPHDPGHRPRRLVQVEVDSLEVLTPSSELNRLQRQGRPNPRVCIGNKCKTLVPQPGKRTIARRWMRQAEAVDVVVGGRLIKRGTETTSAHSWKIGLDGDGPTEKSINTRMSPVGLYFDQRGTGEVAGRIRYHLSH